MSFNYDIVFCGVHIQLHNNACAIFNYTIAIKLKPVCDL